MRKIWEAIQGLFLLGMVGIVGYLVFFAEPSNKGVPPIAVAAPDPETLFQQPVQPLPQHGVGRRYYDQGVAPLEVKTPYGDHNHVIKVVQAATKSTVVEVFARAGQTVNIDLPLGSYEIRYASGETWFGWDYLFGPETTYNKADKIFTFSDDGYQVSGYTVELILQPQGNLHTSGLRPENW